MNIVHPGSVKIIDKFWKIVLTDHILYIFLAAQTRFYNIKILKITLNSSVTSTLYSQVYIMLSVTKCIDNMETVLLDDI